MSHFVFGAFYSSSFESSKITRYYEDSNAIFHFNKEIDF